MGLFTIQGSLVLLKERIRSTRRWHIAKTSLLYKPAQPPLLAGMKPSQISHGFSQYVSISISISISISLSTCFGIRASTRGFAMPPLIRIDILIDIWKMRHEPDLYAPVYLRVLFTVVSRVVRYRPNQVTWWTGSLPSFRWLFRIELPKQKTIVWCSRILISLGAYPCNILPRWITFMSLIRQWLLIERRYRLLIAGYTWKRLWRRDVYKYFNSTLKSA